MRYNGNRTIKVKKIDLIDKIRKNKIKHCEMYVLAVEAYKKEADYQLKKLRRDLNSGNMDLNLRLITPDNKSGNYDKLITMFEMEVEEFVELTQAEFNEYIHDETEFAMSVMVSNTMYLNR